jgi:hypothetical protein
MAAPLLERFKLIGKLMDSRDECGIMVTILLTLAPLSLRTVTNNVFYSVNLYRV